MAIVNLIPLHLMTGSVFIPDLFGVVSVVHGINDFNKYWLVCKPGA
jgi:hypothetical protein